MYISVTWDEPKKFRCLKPLDTDEFQVSMISSKTQTSFLQKWNFQQLELEIKKKITVNNVTPWSDPISTKFTSKTQSNPGIDPLTN